MIILIMINHFNNNDEIDDNDHYNNNIAFTQPLGHRQDAIHG